MYKLRNSLLRGALFVLLSAPGALMAQPEATTSNPPSTNAPAVSQQENPVAVTQPQQGPNVTSGNLPLGIFYSGPSFYRPYYYNYPFRPSYFYYPYRPYYYNYYYYPSYRPFYYYPLYHQYGGY